MYTLHFDLLRRRKNNRCLPDRFCNNYVSLRIIIFRYSSYEYDGYHNTYNISISDSQIISRLIKVHKENKGCEKM